MAKEKEFRLSDKQREDYLEIAEMYDTCKYKFYTPNGACEDVINAFGNARKTGKRIFLFSAANGVGKTTLEFNILANLCFPDEINDRFFNLPTFTQEWKFPKNIYVVTEDSTLREVWDSDVDGLHFWFPEGRYRAYKDDKGRLSRVVTDTGWKIFFKTADQNPRKFESISLGLLIYDEPVSHTVAKACNARLRRGALTICGATPLEYGEWIIDTWLENDKLKKYLYVRYASVYENMHPVDWEANKEEVLKQAEDREITDLSPKRGRLRKFDLDVMISQYDDEEIEARVWGRFKALRGNVYKSFKDEAPYVIPPFPVNNPVEYQVYNIIDPHDRRFPAISWIAIDRNNQHFVVNEYPNHDRFDGKYYHQIGDSNLDIKGVSDVIKEIEKQNGYNIVDRIIDPNFGAKRYGNTGNTVQEEFEVEELYFDADVVDDLSIGHSKVRSVLKVGNMGTPQLQVFETCHNHRWAFKRYRYDDQKKGVGADKVLQSEKVVEKAKDFMDCVRYFEVMEFRYSVVKGAIKGWRAILQKKQKKYSYMGA